MPIRPVGTSAGQVAAVTLGIVPADVRHDHARCDEPDEQP